jgi:Rrf2 family protein
MLELTKKADYALRLMIEVAACDGGVISTAEVAGREDIPYQFLRKVAQGLVVSGLLTSSRGVRGGLALAHPAQTISLLEIVRAVDEPALSRCLIDPAACNRRSRCVIYPVWRRLQRELERAMESITLSDLAERHRVVFPRAADGARSLPRSRPVRTAPKGDPKGHISKRAGRTSPAHVSPIRVRDGSS